MRVELDTQQLDKMSSRVVSTSLLSIFLLSSLPLDVCGHAAMMLVTKHFLLLLKIPFQHSNQSEQL